MYKDNKKLFKRRLTPLSNGIMAMLMALSASYGVQAAGEAQTPVDRNKPIYLEADEGNNKADFEGDEVDYDAQTGRFVINGNAELTIPSQGVTLKADRIEYDTEGKLLEAFGHVFISSNEGVTFSRYLRLNLQENSGEASGDILSKVELAKVKAKRAEVYEQENWQVAKYEHGTFGLDKTVMLGSAREDRFSSPRLRALYEKSPEKILSDDEEGSVSFAAEKLTYYPDKIQNNLIIQGASVGLRDLPFFRLPIPYWPVTGGKSEQQMFSLVVGNNPQTGAGDFNLGPKLSLVIGDPEQDRAISVAPFGQFFSALGFGGLAEYTDKRTRALIAYGHAKERGLAELEFKITEHNRFRYGWNSYLGGGITEQFASLTDDRELSIPILNRFLEGGQVGLQGDVSFAIDSQELRNEENSLFNELQRDSLGSQGGDTTGVRVQEIINLTSKPILEFGSHDYNIGLKGRASTTLRAYTTGNLNAFILLGPIVDIHAGEYADVEIGYDQLFQAGRSPFGFDQVIQGNQSMYANGDFNLTDWFSVGGFAIYSFSRERFTDFVGRVIIGPDDLKLSLGYNPVRRRVQVNFNLLLDGMVNFDTFIYKKDRLGRTRRF